MSNRWKVIYGATVLFFVFIFFGMDSLMEADDNAMRQECMRQERIMSHVGEQIVVGRDTSIIVDADFWHNNYKLDNGKEIDFYFIKENRK